MKRLIIVLAASLLFANSTFGRPVNSANALQTIAFGSCLKQSRAIPIMSSVLNEVPDAFLFLGDNVYADTNDPQEMASAYEVLGNHPDYLTLQNQVPVIATWDDHDYGQNDAGAEYSMREESQRQFLDFFGEPFDSTRRDTQGVYTSYEFGEVGKRIQVIVLDTRFFRSSLQRSEDNRSYVENTSPDATLLGEEQWAYVRQQLSRPADLRLVLSSIQFVAQEHPYEKWQNFPNERQKMLNLIDETGAEGVIFLSGDRHHHELSKLERPGKYPIYDFTSSGLNNGRGDWPREESNAYRLNLNIGNAFGLLRIDWEASPVTITMTSKNVYGDIQFKRQLSLNELKNPSSWSD